MANEFNTDIADNKRSPFVSTLHSWWGGRHGKPRYIRISFICAVVIDSSLIWWHCLTGAVWWLETDACSVTCTEAHNVPSSKISPDLWLWTRQHRLSQHKRSQCLFTENRVIQNFIHPSLMLIRSSGLLKIADFMKMMMTIWTWADRWLEARGKRYKNTVPILADTFNFCSPSWHIL